MLRREFISLLGGALAAWPLAARAQQPMPVIGWLGTGSAESPFRKGLNETGYVEGQNVAIEYRWAEGQYDRLPDLAADLVRRQVTVIAAMGGPPPALAAKAATTTIPIVFLLGVDPVQSGIVGSLNRPGGNITGVSLLTAELAAKRLDLLHELLPTAAVVALLANPTNPITEPETRSAQDAARSLGMQARVLHASTAREIDAAFRTLIDLPVGGLMVSADPFLNNQCAQIVALAARHAVPARSTHGGCSPRSAG
jgi:putative tryptophan/tyrosine transport system substrate-binding protein